MLYRNLRVLNKQYNDFVIRSNNDHNIRYYVRNVFDLCGTLQTV